MRIFHVITLSSVGGAQSVVVNLANAQVENNEVWVISSDSKEAWKALKPEVKVIGIPQLKRAISALDIIVLIKLIYYRMKYRPDVVHLHSSKIGALGRVAFKPCKTIYTVHGFDSIRVANRSFLPVEKLLKGRCAKIVGVSKYDETNLYAEGITKHVTFVYNGITDYFEQGEEIISQPVKEKFEAIKLQYTKVVMCIARDDSPKRIDLFIDVARQLSQYAFVWIGNAKEHKVGKNVFLLGQIPMASLLLRYADVLVLLSDFEGLPMSIIEALSFGKPVIASKVGGIPELLDGSNGYAVANRVEAIVPKIQMVLGDSERYSELSMQARRTYIEKFTVDKMLQGYERVYEEIVKH